MGGVFALWWWSVGCNAPPPIMCATNDCAPLNAELDACEAAYEAQGGSLSRLFGHREDRRRRCCIRARANERTHCVEAPKPEPVVEQPPEPPPSTEPVDYEVFPLPCPQGSDDCIEVNWVFYRGEVFPFGSIAPEQQRVVNEQIGIYLGRHEDQDLLLVAVGATSQEGSPQSQSYLACERATWLSETLRSLRPDAPVGQLVLGQHACADLDVPASCGQVALPANEILRQQVQVATAYQRPVGFFVGVLRPGAHQGQVVQRILDYVFVTNAGRCDGAAEGQVPSATCYPGAEARIVERCHAADR